MADETVRRALTLLDEPVAPPQRFADELFETLSAELELGQPLASAPTATRPEVRRSVSRRWAPLATAAAVLAAAVAVVVVRDVADPAPALALVEQSRERFASVGPFEAEVVRRHPAQDITDLSAGEPGPSSDIEDVRRVTFGDERRWRVVLDESTRPEGSPPLDASLEHPGDMVVADGELFGRLDSRNQQLLVQRLDELDPASIRAIGTAGLAPHFDATYPWLTDDFLAESCTVGAAMRLLDRPARAIECTTRPGVPAPDLEIAVDDATGLLLRLTKTTDDRGRALERPHEVVVRSLATDVRVDPAAFAVTAPTGATSLWVGQGPPPDQLSNAPIGNELSDVTLGDGPVAALDVGEDGDVVALVRAGPWEGGPPPPLEAVKVDGAALEVEWRRAVDPLAGSVALGDGVVWIASGEVVAFGSESSPERSRASLVALDATTGQPLGEPLEVDDSISQPAVAVLDGRVWFTGGPVEHRTLPEGAPFGSPGSTSVSYGTLVEIDPADRSVRQSVPLAARPSSSPPVLADGRVWVAGEEVEPTSRDPREVLVGVAPDGRDPLRRQILPSSPIAITADQGGAEVWLSLRDDGGTLARFSPATGELAEQRLPFEPGGVTTGHGMVWVSSPGTGAVIPIEGDGTPGDAVAVGGVPHHLAGNDHRFAVGHLDRGVVSISTRRATSPGG